MNILGFLKRGRVKTRIAPSPTGPFHVGNVRTALFSELFARKHGGKFVLRIEDTDKERSKKEFEKDITSALNWLGLKYDEFHRQSERLKIHQKYLQKLLKEGKAFYCYHTLKDLQEEKNRQIENEEPPRHICWHKDKKTEPVEHKESIIRLKGSSKKIKFHDLIRGDIEQDGSLLGDVALAKSENEPLYNLACVIDDYEMRITHVIRGEDHIPNTPKQILIHEALGLKPPFYAHLPMILEPGRTKLSSRHGATAVNDFRKMGYLPEALINFMAFLGWNPGDEREIFSKKELIKEFSLEKVQKSAAVFNIEKLDWYNREYIKKMPVEKLSKELLIYLPGSWKQKAEREEKFWKKIIELEKTRLTKLSEITEGTSFFFEKPILEKSLLSWKEERPENTAQYIDTLIDLLSKLNPKEFTAEVIKKAVWDYAEAKGRGNVLWPMRTALTGLAKSPEPFIVTEILGQKETLERLENAKKILNTNV